MKSILLTAVVVWQGTFTWQTLPHRVVYIDTPGDERLRAEYRWIDALGAEGWAPCGSWDAEDVYRQALLDLIKKQSQGGK